MWRLYSHISQGIPLDILLHPKTLTLKLPLEPCEYKSVCQFLSIIAPRDLSKCVSLWLMFLPFCSKAQQVSNRGQCFFTFHCFQRSHLKNSDSSNASWMHLRSIYATMKVIVIAQLWNNWSNKWCGSAIAVLQYTTQNCRLIIKRRSNLFAQFYQISDFN